MTQVVELLPKPQSVTQRYRFDFSPRLQSGETISSATVTSTLYSGTDANPSSMISGSASISGGVVSQLISGGAAGALYVVACSANTSTGRVLRLAGYLAVLPNDLP